MASLYTQQSSNVRKTWFIMALFFSVVIAIGFGATQYFGSPVILMVAVVFSIVMNIGAYWYSDKLALSQSGAQQIEKRDNPDLWNAVENLAITAGLPMPRVYIINDSAPNAFATGRDPKHAAIAVTTGLLHTLDKVELEGVLAHELAHIGNRDILVMSVVVVLVGFIAMLADFMWHSALFGGRDREEGGSPWAAVFSVALVILGPIIAQLMQLAVSRKREYLADASGALLTRYPEGLASALEKISSHRAPMQRASNATAHLFISNPFGAQSKSGKWLTRLFSTHPPAEERIAILRSMSV